MANKSVIAFSLDFQADGVATTLPANLATAPFQLYVGANTGVLFSGAGLAAVTGFQNLLVGGGVSVTAAILLGIATFTFSAAPAAGRYTIIGDLVF